LACPSHGTVREERDDAGARPHALNAEARRNRLAFLAEMLAVPMPDAAAIAAVPDLVQPPPPR
jgi:hypothetical protein